MNPPCPTCGRPRPVTRTCLCSHPMVSHEMDRKPGKTRCTLEGCSCPTYQEDPR